MTRILIFRNKLSPRVECRHNPEVGSSHAAFMPPSLASILTSPISWRTGAHHEISRPFDIDRFAAGLLIDEAAASAIAH